MTSSDTYSRDTRVIRPGASGSSGGATPTPTSSAAAAPAPPPEQPSPAPTEAGGIVAELKPYFPRMALGAALMLFAELWWSGRGRRRDRRREKRRRERRRNR